MYNWIFNFKVKRINNNNNISLYKNNMVKKLKEKKMSNFTLHLLSKKEGKKKL